MNGHTGIKTNVKYNARLYIILSLILSLSRCDWSVLQLQNHYTVFKILLYTLSFQPAWSTLLTNLCFSVCVLLIAKNKYWKIPSRELKTENGLTAGAVEQLIWLHHTPTYSPLAFKQTQSRCQDIFKHWQKITKSWLFNHQCLSERQVCPTVI